MAIFGPDGFPLTSERMQREMDVYAEWKALLGEELAAKYLPEIYYFDSTFCYLDDVFGERMSAISYVLRGVATCSFSFFTNTIAVLYFDYLMVSAVFFGWSTN